MVGENQDGVQPPEKPWQSGLNESFNGRVRDERVIAERFTNRVEPAVLVEHYRRSFREARRYSSLGYGTPVEAR